MTQQPTPKNVEQITHDEAKRKNIPTAEYEPVLEDVQKQPKQVRYPRSDRNRDLDPQLVWRGKDEQDWSDLVVHAPPLYIQEKVHPKALIDELLRESKERQLSTTPCFCSCLSCFSWIKEASRIKLGAGETDGKSCG
ncbi:MAG TPA: hypothetical protein VJ001_13860 [Rhodocyclaceae bacterium]|nr:hypothetical protein [Rhodocyclaceae bacterium]